VRGPRALRAFRADVFFFFTLVTGPRRSLSLKLSDRRSLSLKMSDTRVYEPQIRARLEQMVVKWPTLTACMDPKPETRDSNPELSNEKVYEPYIRARLGTTAISVRDGHLLDGERGDILGQTLLLLYYSQA